MNQYDEKYAQSVQLQETNQVLTAQHASLSQGVSKQKVVAALRQKAQQHEDLSKQTAQAYTTRQIDDKQMIKDFISQRKQYHAYELQKVKIA